jgi:hypothetical protein
MGYRKTGVFHPAEEVLVLTCDVCEQDIGYEDGRRPKAHLCVTQHPNAGALDDQRPAAILCSRECLQAYAAELPDPGRQSVSPRQGSRQTGPRK